MKLRAVLAGAILSLGALISVGCSSDDNPLLKWNCNCGDACAENESDAKGLSSCAFPNVCTPTGDICACPNGDKKCKITIQ